MPNTKNPIIAPAGLLQPIKVHGACDKFGIDLLGPFPNSLNDNKHIIVATEYLTRFAIIKAIPDATAAEVALFLVENIVCSFGCPKEILSDRGVQFRSKLMDEVLSLMHTKRQMTTAYHPQCNGLTERFNATLATMNSIPFLRRYGREPITPPERLLTPNDDSSDDDNVDADSRLTRLRRTLRLVREIANKNLKIARCIQKIGTIKDAHVSHTT